MSESATRSARVQKVPWNECPLCGEELVGGGSPNEKWRRHRRREHYNWGDSE